MTIENPTMPDAPAVEPDTEIETAAPETEVETEDQEQPDTEEGQGEGEETEEQEQPEEVEFKLGAKTIKLPKGAMPDDLREEVQKFVNEAEASTTRRHQEIAEQRKAVEARAEALQRLTSMQGPLLEKFSEGKAIQQELQRLSKVDMNALWQSNPDEARRVSDYIAVNQQRLQGIIAEVNSLEQQLAQAQVAEIQRQDAEGKALLDRRIKGFSQKANEVIEYAVKQYGVDRKDAEQYGLNPVAAEAMYKAMLYDRMQAARSQKPKAQPAPAAPVKPVATGGAARPGKTVDKMSTGELAKHLGLPG